MAAERLPGPRRLLRLWGLYARMEAVWLLRGGGSALAWIVSDTISSGAGIAATFLLAMRFDGIGSWSAAQVVFMLGFALLARGLIDALFGMNVSHVSRRIGRGQLDHMLIQPQPLWTTLLVEGFSPFTGATNVAAGIGIVSWAGAQLGLEVSGMWLAAFVLNLIAALAVMMAFAFAWGALAFWSPHGAEEINSRTWSMMSALVVFPLDGVGAFLQANLLTWIPAGLVAWIPARALTTSEPGADSLIAPAMALVLAAIATAIFHRGLEHYGRTGSVRYLDWGFRR